jgi:3-oxoacyl-[acyl-carrier protein] reductase
MSISFDFTGRTVIVTGAAQGIGLEMARMFHRAGAAVVAADVNTDRLEDNWSDGAERFRMVSGDVSQPEAAAQIVDAAIDWQGRIDILVNNAGITRDAVVWKTSDSDWQAVIGVHLTGTFNLTRAVIPTMRAARSGRIINVTSYTGLRGNFGQSNYAAAKAGIIGFTKTVAKEVAGFGITVNAISPNAQTAMISAVPHEAQKDLLKLIPLGRFADPSEICPAVGFLASAEAAYVTGVVLRVDGGLAI